MSNDAMMPQVPGIAVEMDPREVNSASDANTPRRPIACAAEPRGRSIIQVSTITKNIHEPLANSWMGEPRLMAYPNQVTVDIVVRSQVPVAMPRAVRARAKRPT